MHQSEKGPAGDPSGSRPAKTIYAPPTTTTEEQFAEVMAEIVQVEQVSVDSHFFEDLGADSMVMARFCARVRKRAGLPSVSMKDVYKNPTIRSLAAAVADNPVAPAPAPAPVPDVAVRARASQLQYFFCGVLQFLGILGYTYVLATVLIRSYGLVGGGPGIGDVFVRALVASGAQLIAACTLPVLVKWVLIGRWKPRQIRLWSITYARFWLVKTLVQMNPVVLLAGTPIYTLYLRALGAKVGRDVLVFSIHVPVCTDLLTMGDGAIVRKDAFFNCYRAEDGWIQTGTVSLGKNSFVGEMSVLDIDTSIGDGAQLGHSSSLHPGQSIPDGERRCGSPARHRTHVDYRGVEPASCGAVRKAVYSLAELMIGVLTITLAVALAAVALRALAERPGVLAVQSGTLPDLVHVRNALVASLIIFFGAAVLGLAFVLTVPRLLNLAIKPDRVYRLYGFRYWAHRTIERFTNAMFYKRLFGDSSYIVHYLSWLGYDLKPVVQTGSNFGVIVKHTTPYLVKVGSGTMIADGLSIINAEYSSTSFRVSRVTIGGDNFVGNFVAYPYQGKTGNNCLLGSKLMVPVEGDVREGVGLLGSPAFEIPRTVLRDSKYEISPEDRARRLGRKNRHNLVTMGLFLALQWFYTCALLVIAGVATAHHATIGEEVALTLAFVPSVAFRILFFVLIERAVTGFRDLRPQHCSIYDPYFWFHERYWKLSASLAEFRLLHGTPLKGFIWRLLGVRVGRRLFDDGCHLIEGTMVAIGNDCTINEGVTIQPHSQEDGGFKSDRIQIGSGCTIGVAALIHYGVTIGDGAHIAADSFVMKGEEVPPNAHWGENPAREVRALPRAAGAIAAAAALWPAASCGSTKLSGGQPA